jgi:hypothetical protein
LPKTTPIEEFCEGIPRGTHVHGGIRQDPETVDLIIGKGDLVRCKNGRLKSVIIPDLAYDSDLTPTDEDDGEGGEQTSGVTAICPLLPTKEHGVLNRAGDVKFPGSTRERTYLNTLFPSLRYTYPNLHREVIGCGLHRGKQYLLLSNGKYIYFDDNHERVPVVQEFPLEPEIDHAKAYQIGSKLYFSPVDRYDPVQVFDLDEDRKVTRFQPNPYKPGSWVPVYGYPKDIGEDLGLTDTQASGLEVLL